MEFAHRLAKVVSRSLRGVLHGVSQSARKLACFVTRRNYTESHNLSRTISGECSQARYKLKHGV